MSIRQKQMFIIMLTSAATLLLACAAFVANDAFRFRSELTEQMSTIVKVCGNNCTAALNSNDPKSAHQRMPAHLPPGRRLN